MFKRIVIVGLLFSVVIVILQFCNIYQHQSHIKEAGITGVEYISSNETAFLSDEYFSELDGLFEKVKYENGHWYDKKWVEKTAAGIVLNKMMDDLENDPDALKTHENCMIFFETFDRYIRMMDHITERMHFFRNTLNLYGNAPAKLADMIDLAAEDKWHLFSAEYHLYNYGALNGALNVKFISDDGRFEAVYNTGTGVIVTDPANMGTYNYAPGSLDLYKYADHSIYDKEPWKRWGNVEGFAYEEIMQLKSGRGTDDAKRNYAKVKKLIEKKKKDFKKP